MNSVRVAIFSSKRAEDGSIHFVAFVVESLRRAALQSEPAVCRLYECVLAQAVEGVLEGIQRADVWVPKEPTCNGKRKILNKGIKLH